MISAMLAVVAARSAHATDLASVIVADSAVTFD
jgi:hypothetical protein